jgi:alkylated DNA repair dioxygenase AlkB
MSSPNYLLGTDGCAICCRYDYDDNGMLVSQPIPGLYYYPRPQVPVTLLNKLKRAYLFDENNVNWEPVGTGTNSRQTVQYGYKYNYKNGKTNESADEMPSDIKLLRNTLLSLDIPLDVVPDQCIVNKYLPGQGINAHTDHKDYGDVICCFTLGSGASMVFTHIVTKKVVEIYVWPNTWYVMSGESRWEWTHEMKQRKTDLFEGVKLQRGTRTSITFRSTKNAS